jgi:hypothetical protein
MGDGAIRVMILHGTGVLFSGTHEIAGTIFQLSAVLSYD